MLYFDTENCAQYFHGSEMLLHYYKKWVVVSNKLFFKLSTKITD